MLKIDAKSIPDSNPFHGLPCRTRLDGSPPRLEVSVRGGYVQGFMTMAVPRKSGMYSFFTPLDKTFTHPCNGVAEGICGSPGMAGEEALQLEGFYSAHLAPTHQNYFNRYINRLLSKSGVSPPSMPSFLAWHDCCIYVWQQILQALRHNIRTRFYRYSNGGGGL